MLSFVVGNASDVFGAGFAQSATSELKKRFPSLPEARLEEPYRSEPVEVRGWFDLQKLVASMLGDEGQLSPDPYQAVYLPLELATIEAIAIPQAAEPLHAGSLPRLLEELRRFAAAATLPTDDLELMQLAAKYMEDDALFDQDLDIQTFVQLLLTTKQAIARGQAMWVVV